MRRTACLLLLVGGLCAGRVHPAEPMRPDEVLALAERRFQSVTDYQCVADAETRLGNKTSAGTYQVWFKKPAMLRTRVLRGNHRGSEVAMDREGQVRGRKGGILKAFVVRLSADDKRLRNLRGVPVTELDWGSFYRKCRERSTRPGARMTLAPRASPDLPYEVVVTYPTEGNRMREVYRIDPKLHVLVEGDIFENEVRVDHIAFREIQLDTGLSDGTFKL